MYIHNEQNNKQYSKRGGISEPLRELIENYLHSQFEYQEGSYYCVVYNLERSKKLTTATKAN